MQYRSRIVFNSFHVIKFFVINTFYDTRELSAAPWFRNVRRILHQKVRHAGTA